MHLAPSFLTTTNTNKKKKTKSKKQLEAELAHAAWLKKNNVHPEQLKTRPKHINKISKFEIDKTHKTSDTVGNGLVHGIMANLHKEPEHVRNEILRKAKQVGIAYNKGGYQYLTPGTNPKDLGRKSSI